MAPESAQNYKLLKAEILESLGVTVALRANRVRGWCFDKAKPACAQLYHLMHLFQDWLKPEEKTPTLIVESVALDCFLQGLPRKLHQWVAQFEPQSMDEMAAAVELCSCAESVQESPSITRELACSKEVRSSSKMAPVERMVSARVPDTTARSTPTPNPPESRPGEQEPLTTWSNDGPVSKVG